MKFTGQIRVPEVDHPGVPATFLIEDVQAEVVLDGESLGRWSLFDVHARRLVSSAFQVDLAGEEITFLADEPIDFAYRGVEHMAEVWARFKAMNVARRPIAVARSRRGTTLSKIAELREAMIENLEAERSGFLTEASPTVDGDITAKSVAEEIEALSAADDRREPESEVAAGADAESIRPRIPVVGETTSDESDRLETQRAEAERLEQQKTESDRLEAEKREVAEERARLDAERQSLEADRIEAEKKEADRVEAFRLEMQRLETERTEQKRIEAERAETSRLEMEKLEAERIEMVRLEVEHRERERAELERLEAGKVEALQLEKQRAEMERLEAERVAAAQQEAKSLEAKRKEIERLEFERAEEKRLDAERSKAIRADMERLEEERLEAERVEEERLETERAEEERLEKEQAEAGRHEHEVAEELLATSGVTEDPEVSKQLVVDLGKFEEPHVEPDVGSDAEPVADTKADADDQPEPVLAGAPKEKSGIMGAVRGAFTRSGRNHEHVFVEAPGGIGIGRSICQDCGFVSISSSD